MAYVKKGGWGGRRSGSGAKRGTERRRKDAVRAAAIAAAYESGTLTPMPVTAQDETAALADLQVRIEAAGSSLGVLAKVRVEAILRDPCTSPKDVLEAIRTLYHPPKPERNAPAAASGQPAPERRRFVFVAAEEPAK